MKKTLLFLTALAFLLICTDRSLAKSAVDSTHQKKLKLNKDNSGLKLPPGFSATKFAEGLGEARHLAVTSEGDVYIKLSALKSGKGIYYLHDGNGDGKADVKTGFGDFTGTGMGVKNGYLYASSDTKVFRFKLDAKGKVIDPAKPELIITGLLDRHEHEAKPFTFDNNGNIYVTIGAYSNACQVKDRTKGSPGINPCPILDSAGGIWKFSADKPNQTYGDGERYATGLRNEMGICWNNDVNELYVMQHGRDQLYDLFPNLYTAKQSAELPAECMYLLHKGDNAGWPYMYYDQIQHKKILMPEYGGDGKKEGGENAIDPIMAFPGHLAPDGLLFYEGNMFPEKYKHGAFIAFHGSWNRAPEPQKGFFVAFVPFKDGKPNGNWEIFADNFAGGQQYMSPNEAKHRPCGLAQGPDGSLYVSDDQGGTIFKIIYKGK
ncbi:MAG TPA: PQQ-dependent sugar dehydrogenase [Ginsengibacter sp.]|nr:PQQ-dependent sugar dehydrogenase [Ginsengibacter sp.]